MPEQRRQLVVLAAGVAIALLLACSAACVASPVVLPRLPLPFGYIMGLCAVWQTAPRFRTGLLWVSPYFSAVLPGTPPTVGCTTVPWLPWLPQRGALLFP